MRKLGERNYTLISNAVKITGSFDPNKTRYIYEEDMRMSESDTIEKFMQWCHDNDKKFGRGNYEKVFAEFIKENPPHGKLTLKKLKIHDDMSEETTCFSADLYEDGKLMAHISNRGHGGCNDVRPAGKLKYEDIRHLDGMDVEVTIEEIMCDMDVAKRNQSKAIVLKKGSEYSKIGFKVSIAQMKKNPAHLMQLKEIIKKEKKKGFTVLNTNI